LLPHFVFFFCPTFLQFQNKTPPSRTNPNGFTFCAPQYPPLSSTIYDCVLSLAAGPPRREVRSVFFLLPPKHIPSLLPQCPSKLYFIRPHPEIFSPFVVAWPVFFPRWDRFFFRSSFHPAGGEFFSSSLQFLDHRPPTNRLACFLREFPFPWRFTPCPARILVSFSNRISLASHTSHTGGPFFLLSFSFKVVRVLPIRVLFPPQCAFFSLFSFSIHAPGFGAPR